MIQAVESLAIYVYKHYSSITRIKRGGASFFLTLSLYISIALDCGAFW